jgi:hypothetical protein
MGMLPIHFVGTLLVEVQAEYFPRESEFVKCARHRGRGHEEHSGADHEVIRRGRQRLPGLQQRIFEKVTQPFLDRLGIDDGIT